MISPNAKLPLVIIFERHWDCAPKKVLESLLPRLSHEGYNVFCREVPNNVSEQEIIESDEYACKLYLDCHDGAVEWLNRYRINSNNLPELGFDKLTNMMKTYVSTRDYTSIAERIKLLPATKLLNKVINHAIKSYSYFLKGVDLDKDELIQITNQEITPRMADLNKNETKRINSFFLNLEKLRHGQNGVVFLCGVLHAENLIKKLKAEKVDDVVFYFVHSDKRFDESIDDVSKCFSYQVLENKKQNVNNVDDYELLISKIISDVKSYNKKYIRKLDINSHSEYLSKVFQKNFHTFERPGHYVDSILEFTDLPQPILDTLSAAKIEYQVKTVSEKNYLIIPNVNVNGVSEKIRSLSAL